MISLESVFFKKKKILIKQIQYFYINPFNDVSFINLGIESSGIVILVKRGLLSFILYIFSSLLGKHKK
jgi:hypothetical protein